MMKKTPNFGLCPDSLCSKAFIRKTAVETFRIVHVGVTGQPRGNKFPPLSIFNSTVFF